MSFVVYLAVLLVAAASAMFGLDLLTAPLPPKPPAQVASAVKNAPDKLSQRQAEKERSDKQANNRALSPVYPADPGESKDVRSVSPPAGETTGANHADTAATSAQTEAVKQAEVAKPAATKPAIQAAMAPPQTQTQIQQAQPQQAPQPAAPQMAVVTPDEPAAAAAAVPATEPVAQQAAGHCNIQMCGQAYSSFRASDCTYQPFDGPRRVCGKPSGQKRATASARPRTPYARAERETGNWDTRRNPELDDAVRGVRRMPYPGRYDDADIAGPVGGRRAIVIERRGLWP
jgi:hypothetical protein